MNSRELFIAYLTIVRKEIMRFLRVWRQTLVPPVITTVLYYLIFGQVIGSRVGNIGDTSYMQFIVPGLVIMSVITNAFSHVVTSVFQAKFQRTIEEMLVSPLPYPVMIAGYVTGGIVRALITGTIVFCSAFFFTNIMIAHVILMILIAILTALIFALLGLINGLIADNFDSISIIPNFVLTPLTYLGGVFYSVSMLPDFWKILSHLNPISYIVDAFRYAIHGTSDISLALSFSVMIGLGAVLFCIVWYLFSRGAGLRT